MAWCSVANHFKRIHCIACITVYYVVLAEFKTRIGIPAGNAWVLLIFCKEGEKCSNHCMWSPNFLHTTARNWIQTWFHASLNQAGMKRRLEFDFGALSCLRITSIADMELVRLKLAKQYFPPFFVSPPWCPLPAPIRRLSSETCGPRLAKMAASAPCSSVVCTAWARRGQKCTATRSMVRPSGLQTACMCKAKATSTRALKRSQSWCARWQRMRIGSLARSMAAQEAAHPLFLKPTRVSWHPVPWRWRGEESSPLILWSSPSVPVHPGTRRQGKQCPSKWYTTSWRVAVAI